MKKILSLILCISILFAFSSCTTGNKSSTSNTDADKSSTSNTDVDINIYNTIYKIYKVTDSSSMLLVELPDSVEILSNEPSRDADDYLMLKCKVVEDYFNKIPSESFVHIPLMLPLLKNDSKKNSDEALAEFTYENESTGLKENQQVSGEALSEFLKGYTQAIIYISRVDETQRWYKNKSWNESVQIKSVSSAVSFDYEFIPIKENKVSIDEVKSFYLLNECAYNPPSDYIYDFDDFISDGMSLEKFKNNITNLYQKQINDNIK